MLSLTVTRGHVVQDEKGLRSYLRQDEPVMVLARWADEQGVVFAFETRPGGRWWLSVDGEQYEAGSLEGLNEEVTHVLLKKVRAVR
jgi:hypothetical protein